MCINIWFVFFSSWLISLCIKALGSSISVQFSRSVMSDSLRPHGLQHARPPCPSPTPGVYSNSCPLSRWCHPWWYEKASPQFNWLNFFSFLWLCNIPLNICTATSLLIPQWTSRLLPWRGWGGRQVQQGGDMYALLGVSHVWQKATQHCKATFFQWNINF